MRKPNLFIVGAPKCGTTSVWAWLREHPEVFMSRIKEPHFFNTDDRLGIASLSEYEDLFRDAGACSRRRSIGAVLVRAVAISNILQYQPDARFIVLLRNPIEMAVALHTEMVIAGLENIIDFQTAWNLQDQRRRGRRLPMLPRVLVIVLEELREDARRAYLQILDFLRLDDEGRSHFPAENLARTLRLPTLPRMRFLIGQIKKKLGIEISFNVLKRFHDTNLIEQPRPVVPEQPVEMLRDYFAGDVRWLEGVLGRELGMWRDPP